MKRASIGPVTVLSLVVGAAALAILVNCESSSNDSPPAAIGLDSPGLLTRAPTPRPREVIVYDRELTTLERAMLQQHFTSRF